ncbi:MAG TPA: ABC transporter permease subunit [Anaerolineales bacterium]|nr:ABC transporter permease subunit [Anaerolineales bacterium]
MNIVLRELKANARSLFFWCVFIVFFIYMGIAKFQAFVSTGQDITAMLESMPQGLMDALQMNAFNLTTITGFFGVMFSYFALMATIFAVLLGNGIIAKEEREKTVEFALTLPIPRSQLVTGKVVAAVVNCILFTLVMWGGSYVSAQPYNPDTEFFQFLTMMIGSIFILELVFLAVGVLLGAAMKDYKRSGSVAVFLLLFTFILSIVSGMSENLEFTKYLSPFTYFAPLTLMNESKFEPLSLGLSAAIVVVSLIAAYMAYSKRDLYI